MSHCVSISIISILEKIIYLLLYELFIVRRKLWSLVIFYSNRMYLRSRRFNSNDMMEIWDNLKCSADAKVRTRNERAATLPHRHAKPRRVIVLDRAVRQGSWRAYSIFLVRTTAAALYGAHINQQCNSQQLMQ